MKYLESYTKYFDKFEEYEEAKNSPEYKELIDSGFKDITSKRQKQNGTFAFETPFRHMHYGIYTDDVNNAYYGRVNIDRIGYDKDAVKKNKVGSPTALWRGSNSYEECFMKLLKTEKQGRISYDKLTYNTVKKSFYVEKLIKLLSKTPSKNIFKVRYFPPISDHPELEPIYRKLFINMLKTPTLYLSYIKYAADDEVYDNYGKINLLGNGYSNDIIKWLRDLSPQIIKQINQKIVQKVEEDPNTWLKNKNKWNLLPDAVKEELKYLIRGDKTGLFSLKTN